MTTTQFALTILSGLFVARCYRDRRWRVRSDERQAGIDAVCVEISRQLSKLETAVSAALNNAKANAEGIRIEAGKRANLLGRDVTDLEDDARELADRLARVERAVGMRDGYGEGGNLGMYEPRWN